MAIHPMHYGTSYWSDGLWSTPVAARKAADRGSGSTITRMSMRPLTKAVDSRRHGIKLHLAATYPSLFQVRNNQWVETD
jgi:hypothetical protein